MRLAGAGIRRRGGREGIWGWAGRWVRGAWGGCGGTGQSRGAVLAGGPRWGEGGWGPSEDGSCAERRAGPPPARPRQHRVAGGTGGDSWGGGGGGGRGGGGARPWRLLHGGRGGGLREGARTLSGHGPGPAATAATMLIKEYHVLLPMSLEEYQVAQLYMIQKKSREESSGEGSGVEILANRPYADGPGGSGQYTHKVYHVGSHIPGWFRALLPKAALQVEEESWNAYPYTRTRYTCPFVEKFSIEIETYYRPDGGGQPNVFNLTGAERRQRIVDTIDIVRDAAAPGEYKPEEDPRLYHSAKTGRGPLSDDWAQAAARTGPLMCAYKLCKVEFRYWGMQAKIEQFIHDVGLRRVMLRAHRQAWCWQDEWTDLSMADIRALEEETARMLAQRMAKGGGGCGAGAAGGGGGDGGGAEPAGEPGAQGPARPGQAGGPDGAEGPGAPDTSPDDSFAKQWSSSSRSSYSSQHGGGVSPQSLSEWRMQHIARDSENSDDGDEFFDAHEGFSDSDEVFSKEMTKWNSNDFIDAFASPEAEGPPDLGAAAIKAEGDGEGAGTAGDPEAVGPGARTSCAVHALFLILHSGNILDAGPGDLGSKRADVQTLAAAFDAVTRLHFPEALGHVALRLVPCPPVCAAAYALVSDLSPYSHDGDGLSRSQDHIPLAALPLLATSSTRYQGSVATVIARTNQAHAAFVHSPEGAGFCGQVVLIGDGVGGILGFDALCHSASAGSPSSSRRGSVNTELLSPESGTGRDPLMDGPEGPGGASPDPGAPSAQRPPGDGAAPEPGSPPAPRQGVPGSLQAGALGADSEPRRGSTASCPPPEVPDGPTRLDFKVSGFFLFGSPLGLVLALRKTVMPALEVAQMRPACEQIYNLFHAADPCASRLEPLLAPQFQAIAPLAVPRYQKFPLGDGTSPLLADALQTHSGLFLEEMDSLVPSTPTSAGGGFWRGGDLGPEPPAPTGNPGTAGEVVKILERWWGTKRIDYSLYCPEALTAFPTVSLPHLFHASYWESADVVAFILRQVIEKERPQLTEAEEPSVYSPAFPREKWQRKRTQVKIRVDVYVMTQPLSGKWIHFGTEVTSGSGRLSFPVPPERALGIGVYPVRMVVRGDHTHAECCLTVVARGTEAVVFSIDGSFTASVSIMGSDPKVRAGAVDVVRHWQDSGYLIVYVTGRPDMQKHRVVAWLSQHNFPHGVVSFCDGLTHDPLRQKAVFLQGLVQEAELSIVAGYGSPKDVAVYGAVGLPPSQTFIVGRAVRKLQAQCQVRAGRGAARGLGGRGAGWASSVRVRCRRSSCRKATWPTWPSWRRAAASTPRRGRGWSRAAWGGRPPETFCANRVSCCGPGGPARPSARGPGPPRPPWPALKPAASASSWTARSEPGCGTYCHDRSPLPSPCTL
uniref:Phosphatidylinositol transfer protein membrane associated 1 n=1 Tax=Ornithorhynchus anatinus TaxID=9258 RepID=A0A6I8NXN2_ORNAN